MIVIGSAFWAGWFFFGQSGEVIIQGTADPEIMVSKEAVVSKEEKIEVLEEVAQVKNNYDIGFQSKLENPPEAVKAIYATGWSAGSKSRIDSLIRMIEETELNAIVVDIKDYSGFISYEIENSLFQESGALNEIRISRPNELIKKLHDKKIYIIGRISVFQDPILAKARPEWAIHSSSTGGTWKDRKNLAWMDPASREVWNYNLLIAQDAFKRGFDEVNFDYIRFPSDGNLEDAVYPFWDDVAPRELVIENFFRFLRENLKDEKISADLFGLVTVANDDLGIGQVLEKAIPYFDFVSPMVYPSHFAPGTFGYKNPAENPYEIIKESIGSAGQKLVKYIGSSEASTTEGKSKAAAKIRPWLQDFDLGADYGAEEVRAQITASDEAGGIGWMLWDPRNVYTKSALIAE